MVLDTDFAKLQVLLLVFNKTLPRFSVLQTGNHTKKKYFPWVKPQVQQKKMWKTFKSLENKFKNVPSMYISQFEAFEDWSVIYVNKYVMFDGPFHSVQGTKRCGWWTHKHTHMSSYGYKLCIMLNVFYIWNFIHFLWKNVKTYLLICP